MKVFHKVSISFLMAIIVTILAPHFLYSVSEAEDCTATVTQDLQSVHVPAVMFNGNIYSGDMERVSSSDGNIWFEVVGIEASDELQCENPAIVFADSETYTLFAPLVNFGNDNYRVVLESEPLSAAPKSAKTVFRVKFKVIDIQTTEDPNSVPPDKPVTVIFQYDERVLTDPSAEEGFEFYISVKGVVDMGIPTVDISGDYLFGAASGDLQVNYSWCEYWGLDEDTDCSCAVVTTGYPAAGTFTVNSLLVNNGVTNSPQVTAEYVMNFPPSSVMVYAQCCVETEEGPQCSSHNVDYSDMFFKAYAKLHESEFNNGSFIADGNWKWLGDYFLIKYFPLQEAEVYNGNVVYHGMGDLSLWFDK